MQKIKKQKGITLIALVITIIILLILATITLVALSGDNGILTQASLAKLETMFANYKEEVETYKLSKTTENSNFDEESLTAGKLDLRYNTKTEESGNIKTVIKDLEDKDLNKFTIIKGELYIISTNNTEIKAAQNTGIKVMPYEITEEGELISSNINLALQGNDGTLIIPDIVTSIGEGAFSGVEGLKTITIPGTVKNIKQNAFSYNTTLEKVIIEDGVEKIGNSAFEGCTNLKEITMYDSVITLGNNCFKNCKNLKQISLSKKIKKLEDNIFWGCNNLENLSLPNNLENIGIGAFYYCNKLNNLFIPESLKEIEWAAFAYCNNLTNVTIDKNNNYYKVEDGIIYSKDGKTLVNVNANGVIGTTLEIKEGVEKVLDRAFTMCTKVKVINIPSTLTQEIDGDFFNGMSNLEQINVSKENPKYLSEDNFLYSNNYEDLIYSVSKEETVNINEKVKKIKAMALVRCRNAVTINIPDSVETIEGWVTAGTKLKEINIGKGLKSLNSQFIIGSKSTLNTVNIDPENQHYSSDENYIYNKDKTTIITFIKYAATYEISEGDTKIGMQAFSCANETPIKSIKLPQSLKTIEGYAFSGCTNLQSIEIPKNVETIGGNAFERCSNLTSIKINNTQNSISGAPWGAPKGIRIINWMG